MEFKDFLKKYGKTIFIAAIVFIVVLSGVTGYRYGMSHACKASDGVLVKDVDTGKEFCLITSPVNVKYCAEVVRQGGSAVFY